MQRRGSGRGGLRLGSTGLGVGPATRGQAGTSGSGLRAGRGLRGVRGSSCDRVSNTAYDKVNKIELN